MTSLAAAWVLVEFLTGLGFIYANSVNLFEDSTLERYPAKVRLVAPRSAEQGLQLEVLAMDQVHQLSLYPAPSLFAHNFKLQRTARDSHGQLVIEDVDYDDHQTNNIYHDTNKGAVVHINNGNVEGLISPSLAIKPSSDGHTIYRHIPSEAFQQVADYVNLPSRAQAIPKSNEPLRTDIEIVKPEIFAVLDKKLTSQVGIENVPKYLGIFWNAVNIRFAQLSKPKMQLLLAGSLTITEDEDQEFITKNTMDTELLKSSETLHDFGRFLFKKKLDFVDYDFAYLQTAMDMVAKDDPNGKWEEAYAGLAFMSAACSVSEGNKINYKSAMGEDMHGVYIGVPIAVHELAHNLGAPHDGDSKAKDCPGKDGYTMGYATTPNKLKFSSCSQQLMRTYMTSKEAQCLTETSDKSKTLPTSPLPGQLISQDEQCKKDFNNEKAVAYQIAEKSPCITLGCLIDGIIHFTAPALEGSACPKGGSCINGKCQ